MARPKNDGLTYFPFDVDFFSDRKIKVIRGSEMGSDGLTVYLYLLCEIYRGNGYYVVCDDDLICCIGADTGIPETKTRQIIKLLVSKSLFDNTRFTGDKVLTAASVQRRFQEAKKEAKRDVFVEASVWILNSEETLGFVKVRPEKGFSEKNPDNSEKNYTKESKGKEKKVKESMAVSAALAPEQEKLLADEYGPAAVAACRERIRRWHAQRGREIKDEFSLLSRWLKEDMAKSSHTAAKAEHPSFDTEEFMRDAVKGYKPKGTDNG